MSNRLTNILAAIILAAMGVMAFASIADDTLTFDEVAHIGAGYSYWNNQDYRLNPEHPPLVKDLAGLSLMFLSLNFPTSEYWDNSAPHPWWTQFDFGNQLLYHSGNNPDQIMLFSRVGPILLLLAMGAFLFFWGRKLLGGGGALFLLALFAFCPNFLAHGRLVTTDVGASFGVLLATYFWIEFLKNPRWKNIILAGLAFGAAMLIKFSLILLVPFFAIITIVWTLLQKENKLNLLWMYCGKSIAAALIGMFFVVYPIYALHIANYPREKQLNDTKTVLETTSLPIWMQNINIEMAKPPLLRPLAQYFLGLNMAANRTGTGNTTYFMGQVSSGGRADYFPLLYLFKIPLAFHIMSLIALGWGIFVLIKNKIWQNLFAKTKDVILQNYEFFAMAVFLAIYWAASLIGSLNIGLRHILPTFALAYLLVVAGLAAMMKILSPKLKKYAKIALGILLGWFILSSLLIFPHYLAYYNELAGGAENGYKIAVDSNLDWGQDLKRLDQWIEKYNHCVADNATIPPKDWTPIDKIYLDYFGGGDPSYYLGDKYIPWNSDMDNSQIPSGSYFAVSTNQMMGQRAKAGKDYDQPTNKYDWLDAHEPPIFKIGNSIFIYKIK